MHMGSDDPSWIDQYHPALPVSRVLSGHVSPETAYVVDDYPYGGLRCRIRYWLEYNPKRGLRFMAQTTNPKKGNVWNKPNVGTYDDRGMALYLDDKGHVHCTRCCGYGDDNFARWLAMFGEGVPEAARHLKSANRIVGVSHSHSEVVG